MSTTNYEKCLQYYPMINHDFVLKLQSLVDNFIRCVCKNSTTLSLYNITTDITKLIYGEKIDDELTNKLCAGLEIIRNISVNPVTLWEMSSNGTTQVETKSSLSDLLLKTLNGNYHTVRAQCSNYDIKAKTCKYGNPLIPKNSDESNNYTNEHIFACD